MLYVKANSRHFYMAAGILVVFFIIGIALPGMIKPGFDIEPGTNLFFFILKNNLSVAIISMVGGIFFGVIPFLIASINGYAIGMVFSQSLQQMPLGEVLLKFLPHGMIEIPAIVLAIGFGLSYSGFFLKKIKLRVFMNDAADIFLSLVLPLVLLAAVVEAILIMSMGGIA